MFGTKRALRKPPASTGRFSVGKLTPAQVTQIYEEMFTEAEGLFVENSFDLITAEPSLQKRFRHAEDAFSKYMSRGGPKRKVQDVRAEWMAVLREAQPPKKEDEDKDTVSIIRMDVPWADQSIVLAPSKDHVSLAQQEFPGLTVYTEEEIKALIDMKQKCETEDEALTLLRSTHMAKTITGGDIVADTPPVDSDKKAMIVDLREAKSKWNPTP